VKEVKREPIRERSLEIRKEKGVKEEETRHKGEKRARGL
jgi:hypothetical protein